MKTNKGNGILNGYEALFVRRCFQKCIGSHWHTLLLACVPQIDTMHPTCVIGCISNLHIKLMVLLLQLTGAFLMAKEKHIFPSVGAMCFRWHPSVQEGFAFAYLSGYSILKRVSVVLRSIALLHPRQRTEPV